MENQVCCGAGVEGAGHAQPRSFLRLARPPGGNGHQVVTFSFLQLLSLEVFVSTSGPGGYEEDHGGWLDKKNLAQTMRLIEETRKTLLRQ